MPNWRKVITSGSDASLNTLTVVNGITGSLLGTASYASQALSSSLATTASYALTAGNGGVTKIIAGANVNLSPISGLGDVTVTAFGTNLYNTATGSYGSFYDTGSVTATSATTIYSMSLSTTDISNGVFVSASGADITRVKFTNAGTYNVQFSSQFSNSDNSTQDVVVWLRKNGTDIPDSSGTVGVPPFKAGSNGQVIASWNYYVPISANDFIQLCWHSEQANVITLETIAAGTSPTHPRTPSIILTATRVDTFLSNTGSFSGSFTGILTGTASYASQALSSSFATTASYASTYAPVFPYTGSAIITGSLIVTGSFRSLATGTSPAGYFQNNAFNIGGSNPIVVNDGYNTLGLGYGSATDTIFSSAQGLYLMGHGNFGVYVSTGFSVVGKARIGDAQFNTGTTLELIGTGATSATSTLLVQNSSAVKLFKILNDGKVIITGSLGITGGVTGSLLGTASYATTSQTASYILNAVSASYATTASYLNTLNQDLTFNGNLTLNGTASIAYLNVTYESASVIYSSGSNQFGDATSDTQTLMGRVIVTGSLEVTGSINTPSITGSLLGTASYATQALSASYAPSTSTFPFTGSAIITGSLTVTGTTIAGFNPTPLTGSIRDGVTSVLGDLQDWNSKYYSGEVLYSESSGEAVNFGNICYRESHGQWLKASGAAVGDTSINMLGIALNDTAGSSEPLSILTRGYVETTYASVSAIGEPLYMTISPGTVGRVTYIAPSTAGNIVRLIGNTFWDSANQANSKVIIRFNPDNTWIEL